jgi:hypothetical protein
MEFFGATMSLYESSDHFAASRLLILGNLLPVAPWGALAIVPTADLLGAIPLEQIVRKPAFDAIAHLRNFAERSYKSGPYACSPHVYWWSPAGVERVNIEISGKRADFKPSASLVDAMNALAAGPEP